MRKKKKWGSQGRGDERKNKLVNSKLYWLGWCCATEASVSLRDANFSTPDLPTYQFFKAV